MPNPNQQQERPQDFELIELLFRDLAPQQDSPPFEAFQARCQSFINQIPSYLHSSIKDGFFMHSFLGSFSTLLDTRLGKEKLKVKNLYFRFDGVKTLKIVTETEKDIHTFIFTEEPNVQPPQKLSLTQGELNALNSQRKQVQASIIISRDVKVKLIKINKSKEKNKYRITIEESTGEVIRASPPQVAFKRIASKKASDYHLEDEIHKLIDLDSVEVEKNVKKILTYIKETHTALELLRDVYGAEAREAAHHGFVAGVFNNFRYRKNTWIYLEQFVGRGYADIILLVRGPHRANNSIPIIMELKTGLSGNTCSLDALNQAKEYTKGFQPNTLRILTLNSNILCVGLNLDRLDFMETAIVSHRAEIIPLVPGILDSMNEWGIQDIPIQQESKAGLQTQIKNYLENAYHTFPGTVEKSENHYFSRFMLGQLLLIEDNKYTKHVFIYDPADLIKTDIPPSATRPEPTRQVAQAKQQAEYKGDDSHAVSTMLFVPTGKQEPAILLNVIEVNRDNVPLKRFPLNQELISNRKIIKFDLRLRVDKETFQDYCHTLAMNCYPSLQLYNNAQAEEFRGHFESLVYSAGLKAQFDQALRSQLEAPVPLDKYNGLLTKIAEGIYSIKALVNKEVHFQGILHGILHGTLHGIFNHYSDIRLAEPEQLRQLVLTEFLVGAGDRVDMVIQGIGTSVQATKEYTPVGLELKYDDSIKLTPADQIKIANAPPQQDRARKGVIKG